MIPAFLWFNTALYAVLALWCALRPETTAHGLGFTALSASGRSEYFTIYGGLQWGLALSFAYFAMRPELHRPGLVVAIAIYAPLAVHRVISLVRYGPVEHITRILAVMEIAVLTAAITLYFLSDRLR